MTINRVPRDQVFKQQAQIYQSFAPLDRQASEAIGLQLAALVKLRASQINGCAFCQSKHSSEARKTSEIQHRLDVLPAWREVDLFSEREKAALAWTEAITELNERKNMDLEYEKLSCYFSENEIVNLTALISVINAWNRIAVPFQFQPE